MGEETERFSALPKVLELGDTEPEFELRFALHHILKCGQVFTLLLCLVQKSP